MKQELLPSLYLIKTPEELADVDFFRLLSLLPQERQDRIRKFVFRRNALHTLAGEMITRVVFSSILSIAPQELIFTRDTYGKPHLQNGHSLFFNIAHSGHYVAAAFSNNTVGIDIEYMRKVDLAIAERFFSKKESSLLMQAEPELQPHLFYDFWTLKESYIKAEGRGLSIPLDSFAFSFSDNNVVNFESFSNDAVRPFKFRKYNIAPDYKCAVCSLSGIFPERIKDTDFTDLCADFEKAFRS